MIKCKICNRNFKRINSFHLKTHGIKNEKEYLELHPNAKLYNEDYIKSISVATKAVVNKPEIKEKFITMMKERSKDSRYIEKMSQSMKQAHVEGKWDHCYIDEERNEKISIGRKKWINENKDLMSESNKKGQQTHRVKIGEEKYLRRQKINSIKGIRAAMKKIGPNKFEQRLYNVLKSENIKYTPQYELNGKFYDAYLPEYNTLIEFDGSFFHKETLKECIYPIQKRNFKNDKKKNWIAKNNGYKLIRIKELDYITSVKKLLEN